MADSRQLCDTWSVLDYGHQKGPSRIAGDWRLRTWQHHFKDVTVLNHEMSRIAQTFEILNWQKHIKNFVEIVIFGKKQNFIGFSNLEDDLSY